MVKCDLIIHGASQLLTCASNGKPKRSAEMRNVGLIENGAVAVKNRVIVAVGGSSEITREYKAENVIDAKGKTVAPGFVECHTHIVYAGNRLDEFELKIKGADYLEILAGGGGIISTVRQTRKASLKDLVTQSAARLDKMIALGTTTCEIKTGYGLNTETELKMLEAIFELGKNHAVDVIPTFLPAHAIPPEFNGSADKYVDLICDKMLVRAIELFVSSKIYFDATKTESSENETAVRLNNSGVTGGFYDISAFGQTAFFQNHPFFIDVFCEKNAFDLEQSRRILETAKKFGFKLKAHVDEFTNLGAARMAIELGATTIDHLDKISDDEIKLLAASDTIGVVTPTVNFNFGSHEFADARKLIDSGCAIAVSTDYNPGSAPCPSLAAAMAIACRYQKLLPSEAFNAVTINAAFAVGAGAKTGSLEVGKQADILIFDTDDYRQIAYEFGGNFVSRVIKNGAVVI